MTPLALRLALVLVTDRRRARRPLADAVERALRGGVTAVILREKDLATGDLVALGAPVRDACRAANALFLVNGDAGAAAALGADGVHLPSAATMPRIRPPVVGRSVHDDAELARAAAERADFVLFSPVWDTPSKRGILAPTGTAALREAARLAQRPLVALGGVTAARAPEARAAGATGVAVVGAILETDDETAAARAIRGAFDAGDASDAVAKR